MFLQSQQVGSGPYRGLNHAGKLGVVSAVAILAIPLVHSVAEPVEIDLALVIRARDGERAAFDQLVRRHERGVWRVVQRYVRGADVFDITQQAFVRAYAGLASFRGAATVRSWLYRIAINCALSWVRDHRREQPAEIAEDALVGDDLTSDQLASHAESRRLRAAIAQLPPKQRLTVELRVFDDLAFKEVAELAECSENTAKVNFHHAVKRLRELMGSVRDGG
jgi:RNA polymerase sigma-70 factor (ECF subfamily)